MMSARDYNQEHRDGVRKYSYDFDTLLRGYMMRTLDPFLREGRALELGCYTGDVTELIARRYADLTVVEASDELIAHTKRRVGAGAKFVHATFETAALDGTFDAVFLMHTLEHLDDPTLVLRRIAGWLSKTGRLFVVVPNANAPSRQIAVQMGLIPFNSAITDGERAHGHRKTYSLDTLEREVLDGGLDVVHRGGIFFKPLANYQFDKLLGGDVITAEYLEGCYRIGMRYPDLCASIYVVCEKRPPRA
jgi:2-polyprenyl-3-methyl-5-hydroxy-6-metoxy-1,4-benzoquinol methylase